MKQKVTLARALKEKSRIAGRIHTLMDVVLHENCKIEGSTRSVDLKDVYAQVRELEERMVAVKAAIAEGNGPALATIAEMGECKSMVAFLRKIDTNESVESNYENRTIKKNAVIRKADVLLETDAYQRRIDRLQDEMDAFNASHLVEIEIAE